MITCKVSKKPFSFAYASAHARIEEVKQGQYSIGSRKEDLRFVSRKSSKISNVLITAKFFVKLAQPFFLVIKTMSRRLSRMSGVSGLSGTQRLIDVDLLDDPGSRYTIEVLLGEGTFGEVKFPIFLT